MALTRRAPGDGDSVLARLEDVLAEAVREPGAFPAAGSLEARLGMDGPALDALFLEHVHATPGAFLESARIRAACRRLLEDDRRPAGLGRDVGFPRETSFHLAFRERIGLSPEAYGDLLASGRSTLRLPARFRVDDLLRFHGRDGESVSERVEGGVLRKAFLSDGVPAVLVLAFRGNRVDVALEDGPGTRRSFAEAHAAALRLLGWHGDPAPFEAGHPGLVGTRAGLRIPLTLDPFEALVWAILGQQVNLPFAYALRRDLIRLAGLPAGHGLIAHPDPRHLAALAPEDLQARRCSRRKAEYLVGAAREVAEGRLRLEELRTATGAEGALTAVRGCGVWTARYVMMRGLGFPDCVPVGDAALTLALQRTFALPGRPDAAATERLMAPFAPHRSLATFHLWASLKGVPA